MKEPFVAMQEKWQERWAKAGVFATRQPGRDKYYVLEMFPYPSSKLHMGHLRNYSIGDVTARYRRMRGNEVLYPMGYDAFGLPAENAAIKNHISPKDWTLANIAHIRQQQKRIGLSYDWDREVITCLPGYYRWNQRIFLQMMDKGLAYKKEAPVNWCPSCNTVLANEQVVDGACWRCHSDVEERNLSQWFFRITQYADELLEGLEGLDWPERVKTMQRNWIGRSDGVDIHFRLEGTDTILPAYTTRCDTVYSVTFLVLAPEHPLVAELCKGLPEEKAVQEVVERIKRQTSLERTSEGGKDKLGAFTGRYATNPVNGERIPIWVANFVLMYGTGIVMADAHDRRDFEFARKYDIPLKFVISPDGKPIDPKDAEEAAVGDGILFGSGEWSGMNNREALAKMPDWLEKNAWGTKAVNYKLRDWLISRQRYWGTPIPVVYCDACGIVPVPEKDLPVTLPEDVSFTGKGNPLATSDSFVNTKCPKCGRAAKRETDTMDTFVDSSWYFLRYIGKTDDAPFDTDAAKRWMPVDQYIGGIEHAVLHLLYARFFVKVLRDLGYVSIDEPFQRLLPQGMVVKDGAKMSKSLGNVVDPDEIISRYGADTARVFILFASSPEKELDWSDQGVEGVYRFLKRTYALLEQPHEKGATKPSTMEDRIVLTHLHLAIKELPSLIDDFRFNLALGRLMELGGAVGRYASGKADPVIFSNVLSAYALLLSPFAPHLAEEMWEQLGNEGLVAGTAWPDYDERLIDRRALLVETMAEGLASDVEHVKRLAKMEKPSEIKAVLASSWKRKAVAQIKTLIDEKRPMGEIIKAVMAVHSRPEIPAMVQRFFKDLSRLPEVVMTEEEERAALALASRDIPFAVESEESSKEDKAKSAMPNKPALILR